MAFADPKQYLPPNIMKRATLRGKEYAWPIEDIPLVIEAARKENLVNVGGQLQLRLPDGDTCECYWVEVDTYKTIPESLPWSERVEKSALTALTDFSALSSKYNFLEECKRSFPVVFEEYAPQEGYAPEKTMCFVWYVVAPAPTTAEKLDDKKQSSRFGLLIAVTALLVMSVFHFACHLTWGLSAFLAFVGWPVVGTLVTADDDLAGGWSNPHGTVRPHWRRPEFWCQISLGISISSFIASHEVEYTGMHFGFFSFLFFVFFLLIGGTIPSRRTVSKKELSELITSFLDGSCGKWDWDGFTSVKQRDFEIETIRKELIDIHTKYPPDEPGHYCNEAGRRRLQDISEVLSKPEIKKPLLLEEGSDGKIEQEVLDLLRPYAGKRMNITLETRLIEDFGIDGDEGHEFMLNFIRHFNVDYSAFRYDDYFDSEWRLSITLKPLRRMFGEQYHSKKDLTVQELILAAKQRLLPPNVFK